MIEKTEFDYKKYVKLVVKKRYLFVVIALAIATCITAYSYYLPERYAAQCNVFIEKSVISDLVKGIAVTPTYEDKIRVLGYAMKSRSLLLRVFEDLDMNVGKLNDAKLENMIKSFQDRTIITMKDREGMFIVSFFDGNPRLARDYVNTLVRRYIEENISAKKEESYDATRYLSEQIATVKEKLDKAEANVNNYKRANVSYLIEKDYDMNREIEEARQKLDEIAMRRSQLLPLQNQLSKADPMQSRLKTLQKKLQDLTMIYTDNYPEVIEVKNEIEATQELMKKSPGGGHYSDTYTPELDKISMELRTLNQAEQNHKRVIAAKKALLKNIPAVMANLEALEQESTGQQRLYNELMARYGQSEVSKQMQLQDKATTFRIVDPAVIPTKPFSPNRVKIILIGIFASLALSFGLIVLLDYLDDSVRNVDAIKSLGIPVLAVVPKIKDTAELSASRKRDAWFFTGACAYFSLILISLSFEMLRDHPLSIISSVSIKQNLTQLIGMFTK